MFINLISFLDFSANINSFIKKVADDGSDEKMEVDEDWDNKQQTKKRRLE